MSRLSSWFNSPQHALSRFIVWCLLIIVVSGYGINLWQAGATIQSNILAMLPKISEAPLTQTALNRVEKRLADQVYIGLIADNKAEAVNTATLLINQLKQEPSVFTDVRSGDSHTMQALSKYYFSKRFMLLTEKQRSTLGITAQGSPLLTSSTPKPLPPQWQGLLTAAQQQLYSGFGFASSALLTQDPLLLFPENLLALAPINSLSTEQGILLGSSQSQPVAIVIAKGVQSAFSPQGQADQSRVLTDSLAEISRQYPQIDTIQAGTLFHAQAATETAKFEISTIGSISLIGVMLLVWFAFRSVMPLSLAVVTLSSGFLFATVATLALFGEMHLLTLVFGTSLIGVAIDYSFHFYCEKMALKNQSATQVIQRILPALTLALVTSSIAFIAIGLTPFPGMQQVAIFCAAGLFGAYLTLVFAYPLLANHRLPSATKALSWASRYLNWLNTIIISPTDRKLSKTAIVMMVGIPLFIGLGFTQLSSDDDIRNLQQSPDRIVQAENQLRQILSGGTDNQFILASADSEQGLLSQLEQTQSLLSQAVEANEIQSFVSLSPYLPSKLQQQQNYQAYQALYLQHLDDITAGLGIDESIKPALLKQLEQANSQFIEPNAVLNIAGDDLAALWLAPSEHSQSQQYGSIILLGGINDLTALTQRVNDSQLSITVVDKVGEISQLMSQFRLITLQLLALVCAIAIVIFSVRFGLKLAAAIVLVPVSSILLTLASLGIVGSPLSLFHALALILVLGIGIDYSLFFASVKPHKKAGANGVMMAVFMSACSTLLAFGLLALSQTNAIHYFGLTLLFGIGFTFLLAPLISFITREVTQYGK
ncbi:MMPL family transporter [Shewanella japonica]|uniref:MMPL family transporter n=1 Tax=Shewanella japonica TaxID=93973 RepID=UPI00249458A8|nr:MMPL family transporter [Shewanella japonica]